MADKKQNMVDTAGSVLQKKLTDIGDNQHAERVEAYPPTKLMTDRDGANSRLRVDVGQTAFFAGKQFRSFKEFTIGAGSSYLIKFVTPVNVFFESVGISVDEGKMRLSSHGGNPTVSGTFSDTLPIIPKNSTTEAPAYSPQATMTGAPGGSLSESVERDVVRLVAGTGGQSNTQSVLGDGSDNERGLPAGTYYFLIQNIGAVSITGVFRTHWEERPPA